MTRDGPLWLVILAVGTGAGLGAVCRWTLSYFLNPLAGWMPWGTLASNAAGGLLIGAALAWTSANPELPPAVRLFVITGFLGGLTTISTFRLKPSRSSRRAPSSGPACTWPRICC